MSIQEQVATTITIAPETTLGTPALASSAAAKVLRRTTASLALGKDIFASQEARGDYQLVDVRHGTRRPGGSIEGELANVVYTDLIEALLRGTWVAGVTSTATDFTTVAGAVTAGTALKQGSVGTLTWAAGDPVAKGMRVGDVVRLVGTPAGANDVNNFRITGFGGTSNRTISVSPAPMVFAATAITSMNVAGFKVSNGTVKRSFTIEQLFAQAGLSELYTGMRLGGGTFRLPPNGMATGGFTFVGQDMQTSGASPYFTNSTPAGTNRLLAGPTGTIRLAGVEQGIITSMELMIENSLTADPVVGSVLVPEIYYGPQRITGSVSYFLQDATLINVFANETEVDLTAVLFNSSGSLPDFIAFNMQRLKLNGASKSVSAQGGVIVTSPITALLATAATGVDGATISIQRSL